MKRAYAAAAFATLALAVSGPAPAQQQSGKLNMTFIDTEGGAATLLVSPSGESLLRFGPNT